jgi:hypothetical protein
MKNLPDTEQVSDVVDWFGDLDSGVGGCSDPDFDFESHTALPRGIAPAEGAIGSDLRTQASVRELKLRPLGVRLGVRRCLDMAEPSFGGGGLRVTRRG